MGVTQKERSGETAEERAFVFSGHEAVTMPDVLYSHTAIDVQSLPYTQAQQHHTAHVQVIEAIIEDAVQTFAAKMTPVATEYRAKVASKEFYTKMTGIEQFPLPEKYAKRVADKLLNHSLSSDPSIALQVREATATIALIVGDTDSVAQAKIDRLIAEHKKIDKSLRRDQTNETNQTRATVAETMLNQLGVRVVRTEKPSAKEVAVTYFQEHGRAAAATVGIGVIATSIFASSFPASAAEPTPSSPNVQTPQTDNGTVQIAFPTSQTDKAPSISLSTPTNPADQAPVAVNVDFSDKKTQPAPITVQPEAPAQVEAPSVPVVVATPSEATTNPTTPNVTTTPIVLAPETIPTPSTPNATQQTPEQLAVQSIKDTIDKDGDIKSAVAYILLTFHSGDAVPTGEMNGVSTYDITNKDFLANLKSIQDSLQTTIAASGHSDPNYVNTALTALTVLEAAANDNSTLDPSNKDSQALIAAAVRPSDAYQARLFDQYTKTAQANLAANNGEMLTGYTDAQKAQIQTLYTYTLMAVDSDTTQNTAIQAMKDADAKAAAEAAAAAAAAEAAKQAASGGQSADSEAMQDLVKQSTGVEQTKYQAMQFFMGKGLNSMQAAALVGNLTGESAMIPGRYQMGNGPGRGLAQWTYGGGRWNALVKYAESKGTSWSDLQTQLEFIWIELTTTHQGALTSLKQAQNLTDAVEAIQTKYEVTYASLHRTSNPTSFANERTTRVNLIQGELTALINQITSVNQARAAAAAEAAKRSNGQKILDATEAELAKWVNGSVRPLANGGEGISNYLQYTYNIHTNWCAYFVANVIADAGLTAPPESEAGVVSKLKAALIATGQYTWHAAGSYVPGAGDIAFYGTNRGLEHVNIVVSGVSPGNFDTIGGNEGNLGTPGYAAAYGGKKAYAYKHSYDESYVKEESGASIGINIYGFLSVN